MGQEAAGPISNTAARQQGHPLAQPSAPAIYAPHAVQPYAGQAERASRILAWLNAAELGKELNPYWTNQFWAQVSAEEETGGPYVGDLGRALLGAGFAGRATKTIPSAELKGALELLVRHPLPPAPMTFGTHSATVAPTAGQLGSSATLAVEALRWNHQLPPDMRRAVPEIDRSLRSAGADSARAWLQLELRGVRSGSLWTDLWHVATQVDFILSKASDGAEAMSWLASDDSLEMMLRRLAAYVYEARTRDKARAAAMLAVRAPGAAVDVAPAWLVQEITTFSKGGHQRDERVTTAARRGAAAGRGRGSTSDSGGRGSGAGAERHPKRGGRGDRGGGRRGGGKPQG